MTRVKNRETGHEKATVAASKPRSAQVWTMLGCVILVLGVTLWVFADWWTLSAGGCRRYVRWSRGVCRMSRHRSAAVDRIGPRPGDGPGNRRDGFG